MLKKALNLLSLLQPHQTKFFNSDQQFAQSHIIIKAVIQRFLGTSELQNVIVIEPQNDRPTFTMALSSAFLESVKRWLQSPAIGIQLLCTQLIHGVGHTVLVVLKKRGPAIYLLYVDPYGFPLQQEILLSRLLSVFNLSITPIPLSQKPRDAEQGLYNCVIQAATLTSNINLWKLYLFNTCYNLLPMHKKTLHLDTLSSKIYNKLIRLLPFCREKMLLF
jgi:hypothetical protein